MRMQTDELWRRGVLLAVVVLAACNAGEAEEGALSLESSEAELSCQVSRQCTTAPAVSCSSANGVCSSGAENGGWVECDAARTYCPPACTCGSTRHVEEAGGYGFNCAQAYGKASEHAERRAARMCPAGACNLIETQVACDFLPEEPFPDQYTAIVSLEFSCKEPANCR
ncbi:hypothetical protein LZ199_04395 [Myxococcus sp. QH3KD-4-1]|nr:hypothetical protein [Myxococcus qinghaiensis]